MTDTRVCIYCHEEKARTEFYLCATRGSRSECKSCKARLDRERRVVLNRDRQSILLGRRQQFLLEARLKHTVGDIEKAGRFLSWAVRAHFRAMWMLHDHQWGGFGAVGQHRRYFRLDRIMRGVS